MLHILHTWSLQMLHSKWGRACSACQVPMIALGQGTFYDTEQSCVPQNDP